MSSFVTQTALTRLVELIKSTFLPKTGGTISGNLTVNGTLTGTASKATADASGNNIADTYETKANAITGLSVSGKTITYTRGDSTTGTITTQDTTYSNATTTKAGLMSAADKVALDGVPSTYATISSLATVATSGSYSDLSNKPTIPTVPTDVSAFTNDAGYITSSGSITGNAATATNATNDGNGDEISVTYLPLSGGTMTGAISFSAFPSTNPLHIKATSDGSSLAIAGGDEINYKGGRIVLYGTNSADTTYATLKGGFNIASTDGTNVYTLLGYNNGSLQWDGKEIERVNTSGTGYIRYESGLQICWGTANSNNTGTASVSFPAAFASAPEIALTAGSLTSSASNAVNVQINTVSTTAFTIRVSVAGTWVAAANHYIAIGKWK